MNSGPIRTNIVMLPPIPSVTSAVYKYQSVALGTGHSITQITNLCSYFVWCDFTAPSLSFDMISGRKCANMNQHYRRYKKANEISLAQSVCLYIPSEEET